MQIKTGAGVRQLQRFRQRPAFMAGIEHTGAKRIARPHAANDLFWR